MDERLLVVLAAALAIIALVIALYQGMLPWRGQMGGEGASQKLPELPSFTRSDLPGNYVQYILYDGRVYGFYVPRKKRLSEQPNFTITNCLEATRLPVLIDNSSAAIEKAAWFIGRIIAAPHGDYYLTIYAEAYTSRRYDEYRVGDVINTRISVEAVVWHVEMEFPYGDYWIWVVVYIDAYTGAVTGFWVNDVWSPTANTPWPGYRLIARINPQSPLLLGEDAPLTAIINNHIRGLAELMGLNNSGYGVFTLYEYRGDPGDEMTLLYIHRYAGRTVFSSICVFPLTKTIPIDALRADIVNYTITGFYTRAVYLPVERIGVYNGAIIGEDEAVSIANDFLASHIDDPWRFLSHAFTTKILLYYVSRGQFIPVYIVGYHCQACGRKKLYMVYVDPVNKDILAAYALPPIILYIP